MTKPRETGWTMVIDKVLGLYVVDDLLQVAAPSIDVVKLTFGTSAFFRFDLLKEKVRTIGAHGVAAAGVAPRRELGTPARDRPPRARRSLHFQRRWTASFPRLLL